MASATLPASGHVFCPKSVAAVAIEKRTNRTRRKVLRTPSTDKNRHVAFTVLFRHFPYLYTPRDFRRSRSLISSASTVKPLLGSKTGFLPPREMASVLDRVQRRFPTKRR